MARLRDVPHVLRTVGPFAFAKRVWRQGSDDQLMTWAAALAYSWLFAVFPFFIFLMTLIPYLPVGTDTVRQRAARHRLQLSPKPAADANLTNVETHLLNPTPRLGRWLRGGGARAGPLGRQRRDGP